MIRQVLMAFFGTVAFCVLFDVPRKHYFFGGLTGAVGWSIYALVLHASQSVGMAAFTATVALTVLSRGLSVYRKTPATVFLISGIFTLVPGAGTYYTAFHLFVGDNAQALLKGKETLQIALAICMGIVVVYTLPPSLFGWGRTAHPPACPGNTAPPRGK